MKETRKLTLILAVGLTCGLLLGALITYAATNETFWISLGPYPGGPSYTIFKQGKTYRAKEANGYTSIESTNASYVIQSCIENYTHIYFNADQDDPIELTNSIMIEGKRYITLEGSGHEEILWIADGANCDMFKVQACHQIKFLNLGMYGNILEQTGSSNGITFYGSKTNTDCHVTNCAIVWFNGHGIYTQGELYASYIVDNYIENNEGSGIRGAALLDCVVRNNFIWNNNEGVWIESTTLNAQDNVISGNLIHSPDNQAIYVFNSTGTVIDGNWINDAGKQAIDIRSSTRCVVSNNHLDATHMDGIYLSATNETTVTGNVIAASSYTHDNTDDGIYLVSPCFWNVVTDNLVSNLNTMNNTRYGFNEESGCDYNLFSDIIIEGADTSPSYATNGANTKVDNVWNGTQWNP